MGRKMKKLTQILVKKNKTIALKKKKDKKNLKTNKKHKDQIVYMRDLMVIPRRVRKHPMGGSLEEYYLHVCPLEKRISEHSYFSYSFGTQSLNISIFLCVYIYTTLYLFPTKHHHHHLFLSMQLLQTPNPNHLSFLIPCQQPWP